MLGAFLACAVVAAPQFEKPFKPVAVFRGTHSLIQKPRIELIEDAAAWKKLWDEHRGTDRSFTESDQSFDVDFDTCQVVCVFSGPSGIAPINCGAVDRAGTIHLRYSLGATITRAQFRPEPFPVKPHDSKAEDIRGYMFLVLPKCVKSVVVQEHYTVDCAVSWYTRFPTRPNKH